MKIRAAASIGLGLICVGFLFGLVSAAEVVEIEPNDSPAEANPLKTNDILSGSILPGGDQDYFSIDGINTSWGFIALLDTMESTSSNDGVLAALGNDGTTILRSDLGSWEKGSGIALQNYTDGSGTHYLRVNEHLDDQTISSYKLRYYETVVAPQPEVEPNNSRATGTSSSFTMSGAISTASDVDCFAFHGRGGDTILIALNGDPERDGSPVDLSLKLLDPMDAELDAVNISGIAGSEFIEFAGLPDEGVYAYCVAYVSGAAGSLATYTSGVVRNGGLYFPDYEFAPTWENARAGNVAYSGDLLTFTLAMTNTSPVEIPGDIDHRATFNPDCLSFVSADPPETGSSPGAVQWDELKDGLNPGEVYGVTLTLQAEKACTGESLHHSLVINYFFTGAGRDVGYDIVQPVFLPIVMK